MINQSTNTQFNIYSYGYSYILVSTILIYYIMIPLINTLNIKDDGLSLFNNYYIDNKYKSLVINFLLIYLYLKSAELLPNKIPIIFRRIIIIILFNVILYSYIKTTPYSTGTINFLNKWSSTIGWFAIIWDLLFINTIGYSMDKINSIQLLKNQNYQLLNIGVITFIFMHI
jgi:hypothetical protein